MIKVEKYNVLQYKNIILAIAWFIYVAVGLLLYTSWAFTQSGDLNTFGLVLKATRYFVYALCIVSFLLFSELKAKDIILFIIVLGAAALTVFFSEDRFVFFVFLILITLYGHNEEGLLSVSFIANAFVLFITVLFSQLGIIEDYIRIEGERVRHFLGFSWATYSAIFFFFLVLEFLAVKKGRICLREYIAFMVLNVWFFIKTNTRFAFVVSFAVLTFFLIVGRKVQSNQEKKWYKIFLISPWLIAAGSILLHWFYNADNEKWSALNSLLSGRLLLGKEALLNYPVRFFGQPIEWVGFSLRETMRGEYNYVDCSYLKILLSNGLIFLIIVLALLTLTIYFAIICRKYYLVWIVFFLMVFCVTEPWLAASLAVNPFLLCVCAMGDKTRIGMRSKVNLKYTSFKLVLK